jgi:tRNA pseudouridine13 synthase
MGFEKHVENLPYAHGGFVGVGTLREQTDYFQVDEQLTFEPSGSGEHVFLYIEKRGLNTDDIVKMLSIHAGVPRRSISYAGMKDRHAVTKQWFSVQLPGKEGPDWHQLENDSIKVGRVTRHLKKLKRGVIKFNAFDIVVSQLNFNKELMLKRVEAIKQFGVPNYFMEQRFGYLCQNLDRVHALFLKNETIKNKKMKGLFLSSARAFLFNRVLAKRVTDENWDKAMAGDAFILDGTRQYFSEDVLSAEITERLLEHDIHPTGPLVGINNNAVSGKVSELENNISLENSVFYDGLIKEKVEAARRPLRVVPEDFQVDILSDDKLRLSFRLGSGSYATAVIRELINTNMALDKAS